MSEQTEGLASEMRQWLGAAPPLLVVISGPSGVGKDAVIGRMKQRGIRLHYTVTATTRAPRENEVEGRDYYFVSHDAFKRLIEDDELLEWALVYGDYKGVPKQPIRDALGRGQDVIMRIDVQGAATVRGLAPEALLIFLAPPSIDALAERLRYRDTDSEEAVQRRLHATRQEMETLPVFDYFVVNHDHRLDEAVDQVVAILETEKRRVHPRRVSL